MSKLIIQALLILAGLPALALTPTQKANLTCGSNSSWFGTKTCKFDQEKAAMDMAQLNKAGVRHMRLYLYAEALIDPADPSKPLDEALVELSKGVSYLNKEGLAVIVSPFSCTLKGRFSPPRADSPEAENMVKLWGAMASHFASTDPNLVFLEIVGDPSYARPAEWEELQARCLQAIRMPAPNHVVIATASLLSGPNEWDQIKSLAHLKPLPDPNVVYNFHYQSPLVFTQQGNSGSLSRLPNYLKEVPYPSSPEKLEPLFASVKDEGMRNRLRMYGEQRWNRERIKTDLKRAADWARRNKVQLTCNEFGVYRRAPAEDRVAYLSDVRGLFEDLDICWTVWGDNCGISRRDVKPYSLDEPAARALGLIK